MSETHDPHGISAHGPCDAPADAPALRDNMDRIPARYRAEVAVRLDFGERKYGTPLRLGWSKARTAAREEALDGIAYSALTDDMAALPHFVAALDALDGADSTDTGRHYADSTRDMCHDVADDHCGVVDGDFLFGVVCASLAVYHQTQTGLEDEHRFWLQMFRHTQSPDQHPDPRAARPGFVAWSYRGGRQ